jgi:enoyl-[acyl-carrier protein] reductase I
MIPASSREDPSRVGDAVVFLLSDLSRGMTGEIMHVDGGSHAMGAPPRGARPELASACS